MFNVEVYIQRELHCNLETAKNAASIIQAKGLTVDVSAKRNNAIVLKGKDGCLAELRLNGRNYLYLFLQESKDNVVRESEIYCSVEVVRCTLTKDNDRILLSGSNGTVNVFDVDSNRLVDELRAQGKDSSYISEMVQPDIKEKIEPLAEGTKKEQYLHFIEQFDEMADIQEQGLIASKSL